MASRRRPRRSFTTALVAVTSIGIGGVIAATAAPAAAPSRAASAPPAHETASSATYPQPATPTTTAPTPTPAPSTTVPATAPTVTVPRSTTAADALTTGTTGAQPASTPSTGAPSTSPDDPVSVGAGAVNVVSRRSGGFGVGSGMVLTGAGEVLTNNHVVEHATEIRVTVVTTGATYAATVVGTDPVHDVAVLQLEHASGLIPIRLGNSDHVRAGDSIAAVGNGGGDGGRPVVTLGTVAALDRPITATVRQGRDREELGGLIQVHGLVQPGDSGGPLADATDTSSA